MRSPNVTVLLTGVAVLALGVLLVLDADGTIDLRFAYMAPVLVGALGAILLASGLSDVAGVAAEIMSGDVLPPGAPAARRYENRDRRGPAGRERPAVRARGGALAGRRDRLAGRGRRAGRALALAGLRRPARAPSRLGRPSPARDLRCRARSAESLRGARGARARPARGEPRRARRRRSCSPVDLRFCGRTARCARRAKRCSRASRC